MDNQRPIRRIIMRYNINTYHDYLMQLMPESNFTILEFSNTEHKCTFKCNICGTIHTFSQAYRIARRARRGNKNVCKNCEDNIWRNKQLLAEHKAKNMLDKKETIELVGKLTSWASRKPAIWHCKKCNHNFERSPQVMFTLGDLFCPWCETRPFKYDLNTIQVSAFELWGNEYSVLDIDKIKNKNGSKRILVKHNKCHFAYSVSLYNFLHGQGCPKCKTSHGERKVYNYLKNHDFVFQEQKIIQTENHTLKLDFYLEEQGQKFAIEYNGIQHYEPVEFFGGESEFVKQQERDSEKKKYCQENNITLICIPYNNEYLIESEALAQRLRGQVTE